MAEEIRRAERVRERLLALEEISKSYPAGHDTRTRLENLHLERIVEAVDEELRDLWERTVHPRGS